MARTKQPKHNFLTKQFGLTNGSGGGRILTAGPRTVEWEDGKVVHPDLIEKIYCYGKGLKPFRKKKIDMNDGNTAYVMYFLNPYGKYIQYSAVVDKDGNPTENSYFL